MLSEEDFSRIVRIMLGDLRDSLKEREMTLEWSAEVEQWLVKKSYSLTYGARNLRRLIQKEVEDALASALIDNYDRNVRGFVLDVADGKITVEIQTMQ